MITLTLLYPSKNYTFKETNFVQLPHRKRFFFFGVSFIKKINIYQQLFCLVDMFGGRVVSFLKTSIHQILQNKWVYICRYLIEKVTSLLEIYHK